MVIKIKAPKGIILSTSLIEHRVAEVARVELTKLHKYIPEVIFAELMGVSVDAIRWFVAKSKLAHGVILQDGTFLVHLQSGQRAIMNRFKNLEAKERRKLKLPKKTREILDPQAA